MKCKTCGSTDLIPIRGGMRCFDCSRWHHESEFKEETKPMKEYFKPEPNTALIEGEQVEFDLCCVRKGMIDVSKYEYLGKGTSPMDLVGHYYRLKK